MKRAQASLLAMAALLCGALSLFGWWASATAFKADPFQDWAAFYAAATGYLQYGNWQAILVHWPFESHPWLYPPSFLLLLLPFGFLSFGLGCAAFLLTTFLALLGALWSGVASRRALHIVALILSPAAMINFYLGQNGFLSGALLCGGAMMLQRRPVLAGALFGLLTYKPQLALLAPVAMIATRNWKALTSAAATALLLLLVSGFVFSADAWRSWMMMTAGIGDMASSVLAGRLRGASVFTCATLFGAAPPLANALQALATVSAAAAVYWSWRSPMREELRLVVLFAATILAAPHVTGYDAVVFAFAGSLLFVHGLAHGFRPGEKIVALLAWAWPLVTPPIFHPVGRLTPLFIALVIAAAMMRGLQAPPVAVPGLVSANNEQTQTPAG